MKDAPSWIENLLNPLNSFMDSVYRALNKSLTFTDNISSEIRVLSIQTLPTYSTASPKTEGFVPIQFVHSVRSKPFGLLVAQLVEQGQDYIIITEPVSVDWYEINGTVFINYITGLKDSTNYKLTVLLI